MEEGPFIKVMNVGERIEVNRIEGDLGVARIRSDVRLPSNPMLFLLDEHTYCTAYNLLCPSESCFHTPRQMI